jgi:chromosomal replication initiation ATPase DnaA
MYVARKMTGRSTPVIAYYMGNRDHTTILHGVRVVKRLLDAGDVATTAAVRQITERLQMTAGRI